MVETFVLAAAALFIGQAEVPAPPALPERNWRQMRDFLYIPPQVRESDYPPDALLAEAEGVSLLRLEISAEGRVQSCSVIQSAGLASMDAKACRLWQERGRFKIREGVTTPIIARAPVRWQLGDKPASAPAPATPE